MKSVISCRQNIKYTWQSLWAVLYDCTVHDRCQAHCFARAPLFFGVINLPQLLSSFCIHVNSELCCCDIILLTRGRNSFISHHFVSCVMWFWILLLQNLVYMCPLFTVLQTTIKSVAVVDTIKSVISGTMAKSKAWIVFK